MADNGFITLHWNAEDLTGRRFGRLVAVGPLGRKNGSVVWLCRCDCGRDAEVKSWNLKTGITSSCGCLQREVTSARSKTHGLRHTPEYNVWNAIRNRTSNAKCSCFGRYGGRGIRISPEWFESFEVFIRDMGPRPSSKHSVERRNNDGDYEAGNCFWATGDVQRRNTRRSRFIEYDGQRLNLVDAAQKYGIAVRTLWYRLNAGWPVEKALLTPVKSL